MLFCIFDISYVLFHVSDNNFQKTYMVVVCGFENIVCLDGSHDLCYI